MADLSGVSLNLVDSFDVAQALMSWFGERRPFMACDTETGGLEWWRQPLRMVQFGDLNTGWAVPWEQWGGVAKDILRQYRGPLVFQNAKFDMHFLERNGCKVRRGKVHDTRALAHLLDPDGRTDLKGLAVRHVDRRAANGQSELKRAMALNKWTWATVPIDLEAYWAYAALDPVLTAHLYKKFRPKVVGPLDDVYELEIACAMVLGDIERRGIRVDLGYCATMGDELRAQAAKARAWVKRKYGFEAGANGKVAAQLQRDGAVLAKRTPTGAWSMDEAVLAELADDHKLARRVLAVRKAEKTASAYFGNFSAYAAGDILHPDINPLGARTGRMSVSRPALQQLPRTRMVRDAFVPREGNRLLAVDWDQLEARLMAHFSRDKGLIGAFGEGDFFANVARQIYNDDSIAKGDPRRQRTKSTVYSKMYGAGAATFARTAKIPEAEAVKILADFDRRFPGVRRFQRELDREAQQRAKTEGTAYVTTPLGRRQPVGEDVTYKVTNYKIQGTAADMFKRCLVDLDAAGLADALVLPVHDEAVFDVAASDAEELGRAVVNVFEAQGDGMLVRLTAGATVMERWGEKYA